MTTSSNPEEIRAEIERTRQALSDDVDALADTANPKNIANRQVDKVKSAARGVKEAVFGADDDPRDGGKVGDLKDAVTGRVSGAGDSISGGVSGAGGALSDRASAAGGAISDKASAAGGAISDKASQAGDAIASAPQRAKQGTRGNPLAAGLIAFGAGLLISGLIPSSQKEQRAVADLQRKAEPLKEKAAEAGREIADNLKGTAQEAVESVKATATEGVENVKAEGQSAKDQVQGQVQDSKESVKSETKS